MREKKRGGIEVCLIQRPVVVTCPSAQIVEKEEGKGCREAKIEIWASPQLSLEMMRPHLQPETSPMGMEGKTQATQSCALLLHKY